MRWSRGLVLCWRRRRGRHLSRRSAGSSGSAGTPATAGATAGCGAGGRKAALGGSSGRGHRGATRALWLPNRWRPVWRSGAGIRGGAGEGQGGADARASRLMLAGGEHDRRALRARGADGAGRRRRAPPGAALFAADAPNDVRAMDFKGWFRTGDGMRCDTLTPAAGICCAARRWDGPTRSMSGRSSTLPSGNTGCRSGSARITSHPSRRPARAGCRGSRSWRSRPGWSPSASRRASPRRTAGSSGCT